MTSLFAWNMREFNMARKHNALRTWIPKEKPLFGCLVETRVQKRNHQKCMSVAMPHWNSLTNYEYHPLGRIWVCWSEGVVVTWLHMSSQIITCAVQIPDTGEQFICSAVYAFNTVAERAQLWENIRGIKAAYDQLGLPWILIGDYNETLASVEHLRGFDYRSSQVGMRQF